MNQNNIQSILKRNSIIPVVTFNKIEEIDNVIKDLKNQNIHCIEVTLRTSIAFNAIEYIKDKYATEICIGAGTVINHEQIKQLEELNIDFIVSPAISKKLIKLLVNCSRWLRFRSSCERPESSSRILCFSFSGVRLATVVLNCSAVQRELPRYSWSCSAR